MSDQPLVQVPVVDLYKQCSYPARQNVLAASDTCQHGATTAVHEPERDAFWWRCRKHEGQIRPGVTGAVHTTVPMRKHPAT